TQSAGKKDLLAFLINFTTRGVQMTEPVEGWIERAGHRCVSLGWTTVGEKLISHAKHERDHHLMMIEDARRLSRRWHDAGFSPFDVDALFDRPPTSSMISYIDLHERMINSTTPFAQVAIEREIEGLSIMVGPTLVEHCRQAVGADLLDDITFISHHVEIDAGHTAFNEKLMQQLLSEEPEALGTMVEAGRAALSSYLGFMTDCAQADFVS
ncbi:MAG: iron-containing redox enzyme family protein, partial [Myxococcota bacterium]